MTFHDSNLWRLFNNVLLQIVENMGEDITPKICEGTKGKPITKRTPGAERKQIDTEKTESDPYIIMRQFAYTAAFVRPGNPTEALVGLEIYIYFIQNKSIRYIQCV